MNNKKLDIKALRTQLTNQFEKLRGYSFILFLLFIAGLYGFVFLRINSLSNATPSANAVTGQVRAAQVPHIEKSVVEQLESLQDNSVNVQTLFDQARSNPFQ